MTKEEFEVMEVKAKIAGWYFVTLYQFEKTKLTDPGYIRAWLEFDGINWIYGDYTNKVYVCFIHNRDTKGKLLL